MSETFNDGDPIDAATLQRLKTEVAKATALAGAKVSAGSSIDIKNLTEKDVADFVPPRFFGGMTKSITLNPGKRTTFDIIYSKAGFNGKPSAIILTPIAKDGEETMGVPSVISGTVGPESARGQILGGGLKKSSSKSKYIRKKIIF